MQQQKQIRIRNSKNFEINNIKPCPIISKPKCKNSNQSSRQSRPNNENNMKQLIRDGDWVCIFCKNLNFSFRNQCNRCRIQTKQQNYFQQMLQSEFTRKQCNTSTNLIQNQRKPLDDLTNKFQPNQQQNQMQQDQKKNKSTEYKSTQENDYNIEDQNEQLGYQSCILLTPQKYEFTSFQEQTSPQQISSNKQQPYRSPQKLPSISPLIKLFKESQRRIIKSPIKSQKSKTEDFFKDRMIEEEVEGEVEGDGEGEGEREDQFQNSMVDYYFNTIQLKPFLFQSEMIQNAFFLQDQQLHSQQENQIKRKQKDKKEDWICPFCMNVNYSFRIFCNRCKLYSIDD